MKTLIVHPKDNSTNFLKKIYESIEDKTIVTGDVSKDDLKEMVDYHDRIMMMGHGCPKGLFDVGVFKKSNGLIIDDSFIYLLKQKKDNVFIWCNADKFVKTYNLKGFFSGMFISEVSEANYCGLYGTSQDIVDESNYGFTEILSGYINHTKDVIYEKVRKEYGIIADQNPVAFYNNNRLYYR